MDKSCSPRKMAFIAVTLTWLTFFSLAALNYQGTFFVFLGFSLASLLCLVSGFYKNDSYAYTFLTVFLWLGFWFKLTVHLIYGYKYVEPIGLFDFSSQSWDTVLHITTVALVGVLCGRVICFKALHTTEQSPNRVCWSGYPAWYPLLRGRFWLALLLAMGLIGFLNAYWGILQIGLAAKTILPWPFNAVIAWSISIGIAIGVATIFWWELNLNKRVWPAVLLLPLEAFISTVSLLSRGVYIFHCLPQLFSFAKNKNAFRKERASHWVFVLFCSGFLFFVAMAAVTTLRANLYPYMGEKIFNGKKQFENELLVLNKKITILEAADQDLETRAKLIALKKKQMLISQEIISLNKILESGTEKNKLEGKLLYQLRDGAIKQVANLAIDRWVGLEGVMAVAAYPEKNMPLFTDSLKEKRSLPTYTKYQEICQSIYRFQTSDTWQLSSLPGCVAFLYFSNSILVVFFGMMIFVFLIQFAEYFVMLMTENPILCSLLSMLFANLVAQFGEAPRQNIPFLAMTFAVVIVIGVMQKLPSILSKKSLTHAFS